MNYNKPRLNKEMTIVLVSLRWFTSKFKILGLVDASIIFSHRLFKNSLPPCRINSQLIKAHFHWEQLTNMKPNWKNHISKSGSSGASIRVPGSNPIEDGYLEHSYTFLFYIKVQHKQTFSFQIGRWRPPLCTSNVPNPRRYNHFSTETTSPCTQAQVCFDLYVEYHEK